MAKTWLFYPKDAQKSNLFWNQPFFKLQTSIIAQNDNNKILSNFVLLHFFPGCLEKLKNGKTHGFLPEKCPKNQKNLKSSNFQATDLHDSSKWLQ